MLLCPVQKGKHFHYWAPDMRVSLNYHYIETPHICEETTYADYLLICLFSFWQGTFCHIILLQG